MAARKKTTKTADAFESVMNVNPQAFNQGYEKFAEGLSVFADFQKDAMEAMMTAAGVYTKGVEKFTADQAAFMKTGFEDGVATAKAVSSASSFQEAVDLNTGYVRETIEKNLAQVNKAADMWIETTKETVDPLTERYGELVERIQTFRP